MDIQKLKEEVIDGKLITKDEAMELGTAPVKELCDAANEIRAHFCGNKFDLCAIINAKNGRCSEDCKYCAQSSHYHTDIESYPLLDTEAILNEAEHDDKGGVQRYGIVTSGRNLSDKEVDSVCDSIRAIRKNTNIAVCVSLGLLSAAQFGRLKEAGASRVHNNLESSPDFFKKVCTTHTTQDKVDTIKAAQSVGLTVCSGGIMGLGETIEDRIDQVLYQRELGIKSIPVNVLSPIPGTPFADNKPLSKEEICRTIAVYRFIIPDAFIRMAGGRGRMDDKGKACFESGANAAITGDMLTTSGYTIETDLKLIHSLGFEVLSHE